LLKLLEKAEASVKSFMAKGHKPVAGSRAYWPRKRAARIYSSFRSAPGKAGGSPLVFAGYKAGMTRIVMTEKYKGPRNVEMERDRTAPVTVLDCPPLVVCGIRTYRQTPYGLRSHSTIWTESPAKDLSRKVRAPKAPAKDRVEKAERGLDSLADVRLLVHTKPRESGIGKKKPEVFEIPLSGQPMEKWEYAKGKLGDELRAPDVFLEGEIVDARSVSTGKGYTGPVKRFGIKIRPRKHEKKRRHVGSLGPVNVARVLPGKVAFPGQHGYQTRTEYSKRILGIRNGDDANPKGGFLKYGIVKGDYILLSGSVPGPKKRLVMLRRGIRARGEPAKPEIKRILTDSQQGV
jgi:large subunit ribosomal protein L3